MDVKSSACAALSHRALSGVSRQHLAKLVAELAPAWEAQQEPALRERRGGDHRRTALPHRAPAGHQPLASLGALRFDTVVLGCCGLTADDGPTACDLDEAMGKKAAVASARRVIAATDSEIGRTARLHVGPPTVVQAVVTDATAGHARLAALQEAGSDVVSA